MTTVAQWYDLLNPWDTCDDFYLDLVMRAERVVDVGCGTGALLHRARERGHRGYLTGIDPDPGMLAVARRRNDIEWRQSAAKDLPHLDADLITMTGHAFQTLVGDDDLTTSLRAIHTALGADGRFAFETRNPAVEPWQHWDGEVTVTDSVGDELTVVREVKTVEAGVVTFDETYTSSRWTRQETVHSTLRFLTPEELGSHLSGAGLAVDQQFGDWHRGPITPTSPEIITIARHIPVTSSAQ
ncbi:class I SAM-dependent DNA methyltransferase [Williamsia sp. M5A3_1d]